MMMVYGNPHVSGRKKVEVLLQQMFQSEIDNDDFGPEEVDEGREHKLSRRRLTLDTVW